MSKPITCIFAALAIVLSLSPTVGALQVVDNNPGDQNTIIEFYQITGPGGVPGIFVKEDYNESFLSPYQSHDGYAIVNRQGGFFDKFFIMESGQFPGQFIFCSSRWIIPGLSAGPIITLNSGIGTLAGKYRPANMSGL